MKDHSISRLISELDSESVAASELWEHFIHRMIATASRKLKSLPRRMADEEDIALDAFNAFLNGHKEGRFTKLENREDLWQVLAMLVERRAIREFRFQLAEKRNVRAVRGESVFANVLEDSVAGGLDNVAEVTSETASIFTHGVREILESIGDEVHRKIAIQRLAGFTNAEIAEQLGVSKATIERKFRLLRDKLKQEFAD